MPVHLPSGLMASISGFRGKVGESLGPELAAGLAAAYGSFLREEGDGDSVLVGRDTRTSGPMLQRAVVAGLLSAGCRVTELGVVPTPTALMAVADAGAAGGIVVTASHNPAEWNAFKFAVGAGTFLSPERMDRFLTFLRTRDPAPARWDALQNADRDEGAVARHLERILALPFVDVDRIRDAGIAVALDCVNGAGNAIMPPLLERLGCRVEAIGATPDGRFPRDPEPTPENLRELCRLVRDTGAQVGFAVDPDADRLSLVDEKGRPLGEDLTLALAAEVVLRRRPGTVVTNLSTSRVVEDAAARRGCPVVRAPVGEIHVAARMIADGAAVGGEGNGGVIVPALHHTRDAAAAAALILQRLVDGAEPGGVGQLAAPVPPARAEPAGAGRAVAPASRPPAPPVAPPSSLVAQLPAYQIVKEKNKLQREMLPAAYRALLRDLPEGRTDRSDGLRIEWPEARSWLHVRPSGTEPVVRLIAEAPARAADAEDPAAARRLVDRAARILAELPALEASAVGGR